jgi:hypothetical protein
VVDTVIYRSSEFHEAGESVDRTIEPAKVSKTRPSMAIAGTWHNLFITDVGCNLGVTSVLGARPGG